MQFAVDAHNGHDRLGEQLAALYRGPWRAIVKFTVYRECSGQSRFSVDYRFGEGFGSIVAELVNRHC